MVSAISDIDTDAAAAHEMFQSSDWMEGLAELSSVRG